MHQQSLLLGIVLGFILGFVVSNTSNTNPKIKEEDPVNDNKTAFFRQVREDEEVCPVISDAAFENARVTFFPVAVENREEFKEEPIIGQNFDSKELGKDLYKYGSTDSPWTTDEIDIDWDLEKEEVYYGNVAMNHTPHLAYVVKGGKVIFMASGANVSIEPGSDGIEVTETLDWNSGKFKKTHYKHENNRFIPTWYQISCVLKSE